MTAPSVQPARSLVLRDPDLLKAARKHAGLTQVALAGAAGCHKSFPSHLESGRGDVVNSELASAIASALGVQVEDLFQAPETGREARLPRRLRTLPPAAEMNEARAYSLDEVAALISFSREFVYDLCRDGSLRHAYLGRGQGAIRVRHTHLLEYLDAQEH